MTFTPEEEESFFNEAIEAHKQGTYESWEEELEDRLEGKFSNEGELDVFLNSLSKKVESKMRREHKRLTDWEKEVDKSLGKHYYYTAGGQSNRLLKEKHLDGLKLSSVTLKAHVNEKDFSEISDEINRIKIEYYKDDARITKVLDDLLDRTDRILSEDVKHTKVDRNFLSLIHELGSFDLSLAKDRQGMYDFWEDIHELYEDFIGALIEFKDTVDELPDENNEELKQLVDNIEPPPNYILELSSFELGSDNLMNRIYSLLQEMGMQFQMEESEGHWSSQSKEFETKPREDYVGYREAEFEHPPILLDPLLYYAIQEELLTIPISPNEVSLFREQIDKISNIMSDSNKQVLQNVLEKVEREIDASKAGTEYNTYLPISPFLGQLPGVKYNLRIEDDKDKDGKPNIKNIKNSSPTIIEQVNKETGDFFKNLAILLAEQRTLFPISQSAPTPVGSFSIEGRMDKKTKLDVPRAQPALSPKKRAFPKELKDNIKALKKAINRYYIIPLGKGKFLDEKPSFSSEIGSGGKYNYRQIKIMWGTSAEASAEMEHFTSGIENIDSVVVNRLINYFNNLASEKVSYDDNLHKTVEGAVKALNVIFPELEDANEAWGGWRIYEIASAAKLDISKLRPFMGEDLGVHNKVYEQLKQQGQDFPLEYLESYLKNPDIKHYLERAKKYQDKTLRLDELLESIENVKRGNNVAKAFLNAYDNIRGMQGKEIIYANCNTNNIEHMDYVISNIKKSSNVDITTLEIDNIVKSINSYSNLSNRFGISEEIIYQIKGLCR